MSGNLRIVAGARRAVGSRFRLHGRDPALGLDCVGLVAVALAADGHPGSVPADYALRSGDVANAEALLRAAGLVLIAEGEPGDVVLLRPGAGQLHLAILIEDGVIHADAMLRRVVERPGALPFPVVGTWRWQGGEG
ncbi:MULTISPECIES: peptidoglycan endopeptidase [Sphingomonas]|uniref:Peptidoglycan endopeptidase n=1 Tax=Sphingomonas molluscorum TaxID=418184 RepID=A0ABU8Q2H0_9SPHN|nr:peptidoglycan endopeptidase [Sphingomonas sp. JUb134]MBM7405365.1 cell wall-associated NlpC family hydrolase [Sphingomonas sp. JUb134]